MRVKGKKRVVVSHVEDKALKRIKEGAKERLKSIQFPKKRKGVIAIDEYNSYIMGVHNYYRIATNINSDVNKIAFDIRRSFEIRLRTRMTKIPKKKVSKYIKERYGKSKQLRYIGGKVIIPLGYVQHKNPMYKPYKINNYTKEGRNIVHENLQCVDKDILDYIMKNPIPDKSVEWNDNRISLYVAQKGKCAITGYPLTKNMEIIYKKKLQGWRNDKYQNLLLISQGVKSLIYIISEKEFEGRIKELKLNLKKREIVNKLRSNRYSKQV